MIVWLSSYPRSGNTYLRMLLKCLYGCETYSVYNDPLLGRLGADDAVGHQPLPGAIQDLRDSSDLYFVKTHGLPTDDSPAIHVVRDGRAALVSYAHFRLSYAKPRSKWESMRLRVTKRPFRYMLRTLIVDTDLFGGWSGNVQSWTSSRLAGQTALLRYEDLVADPPHLVAQTLNRLELDIPPISREVPSFAELQSQWPGFFRKGSTDSWRSEMPSDLHELFWQNHQETMAQIGYEREQESAEL